MRVLAIETSGRHGSIALLEGEGDGTRLVGQTLLAGSERTAQALAPALKDLLAEAEWPADSIGLVSVAVGPGSFTGLRIGVTTAKILAYAVGAQVIGVNTLSVLAGQVPSDGAELWAVVDAQRQELFAAKFACDESGCPQMTHETHIIPVPDWLADLVSGDRVTGPALQRLHDRLPDGVTAVPEECWQPTAHAVGRLGWTLYQQGQRDDVWQLVPRYYRPSAAEEKKHRQGDKETRRRGDVETR